MSNDFLLTFLPYYIQRQPDGRWAVLNRWHKPLGLPKGDWIEYGALPSTVALEGVSAALLQKLKAPGSREDPTTVWLYNVTCIPTESAAHWDAYQARLRLLASLKIA